MLPEFYLPLPVSWVLILLISEASRLLVKLCVGW